MILADALMRGIIIGIFLMIAIVPFWQGSLSTVRLSLIAVMVTLSAWLIEYAPYPLSERVHFWIMFVCGFLPAATVWLSQDLLLDRSQKSGLWTLSCMIIVPICLLAEVNPAFDTLRYWSIIVAYVSLLIVGLATWRNDLVQRRRQFRTFFLVSMALVCVLVAVSEFVIGTDNVPLWGHLLRLSVVLVLVLIFAHWLLTANPATDFETEAPRPSSPIPDPEGDQDGWIIAKLTAAIDAGIWRREGLTITALAADIGVPEYRLRETINQRLGYRNFPAFINSYRIDAARSALSARENSGRSILEIAYDCGFASLGPFNRAFRDATGQSPREFRQAALGDTAPIAEKTLQFVK